MKNQKIPWLALAVILVFIFYAMPSAFGQSKTTTERECILTEGGEVIWDLRSYQWVCCIPRGEDLEDCIIITDKKPLPKTGIKPLPPAGSKKIIQPKQKSDTN